MHVRVQDGAAAGDPGPTATTSGTTIQLSAFENLPAMFSIPAMIPMMMN
jgi:hypothetical protein